MRRQLVLAFAFWSLGLCSALAADISGTWKIAGPITPSCTFTQTGNSLSGACRGPGAEGPLSGSIDGQAVKWVFTRTNIGTGRAIAPVVFSGTLNGQSLSGTMSQNGGVNPVPFTALFQPGATPIRLISAPAPQPAPTPIAAAQNRGCAPFAPNAASAGTIQACTAIIDAGQAGNTELATAHASRAFAYLGIDNLDAAERDAAAALTLDPGLALAHLSRGQVYLRNNAVESAVAEFDAAIKIDPNNGIAYNDRGAVMARTGRNEEAISDLTQAIRLTPNARALYANRSTMLQRVGKFAEAVPDTDHLKALAPDQPVSWNSACWARAIWGQELETALGDCDKAVTLAPANASFLDSRCLVKFRMEKYDEAVADCSAALKIMPRMAAALYVRGLALMKSGHRSDGSSDVAAARRIGTDVEEIYARYGVKP